MKNILSRSIKMAVAVAVVSGAVLGTASTASADTITLNKGAKGAPNCSKGTQQVFTTPLTYYIWGRTNGSKTKYVGTLWVYQSQIGWLSSNTTYKYNC